MSEIKSTIRDEATREDFGIERAGYDDITKYDLKCINCDETIVTLQIAMEDVPFKIGPFSYCDDMKFYANCPHCGGKTFKKKLHRVKVFFIVGEGLTVQNVDINPSDQVTFIEVIK